MNSATRLFSACVVTALTGTLFAGCGSGTSIGATHVAPTPAATNGPGGAPTASSNPTATGTSVPTPSSAPTATSAPTLAATATPSATPVPPPAGGTSSASIYLGDIAQGAVLIYSSNANGKVSPSAIIAGSNTGFTDSAGSSQIYGIAVDETGTVYVLTQTVDSTGTTIAAESILAFPAGTTGNVAPARTISLPTSIDAESLAYSASNLYVTDQSGTGAIDVYASSATGFVSPLRTFTDSTPFPNLPLKVSVDASGNTYVATNDQTATAATEATQGVYEFSNTANGMTATENTTAGSNTGFESGVLEAAVIDAGGTLDGVVQDATTDTTADIDEFASGATGNATPTITFADTSSQGPIDAAVDAARNLYVSEVANSSQYAQVNVFGPGTKTPQQTIEAYEGELPLIAIGPYVATSPSGQMQVSLHEMSARKKSVLRKGLHERALRIRLR